MEPISLCAISGRRWLDRAGFAAGGSGDGTDQFVRDAREAGADGLIVPDLPPEEAAMFCGEHARARDWRWFSSWRRPAMTRRIDMATKHATGFRKVIYVVSLTGILASQSLARGRKMCRPDLTDGASSRVCAPTDGQAAGFGFPGIGRTDRDQGKLTIARQVSALTDGFIVGSFALVRAGGESVDAVRELAGSMRGILAETE